MGAHQKRQWIRVALWRTYAICEDSEGQRGKSVLKRRAVGLYTSILCDRGAVETQSLYDEHAKPLQSRSPPSGGPLSIHKVPPILTSSIRTGAPSLQSIVAVPTGTPLSFLPNLSTGFQNRVPVNEKIWYGVGTNRPVTRVGQDMLVQKHIIIHESQ